LLRPISSILFDQSLSREEGDRQTDREKGTVDRQAGYLVGTKLGMQASG